MYIYIYIYIYVCIYIVLWQPWAGQLRLVEHVHGRALPLEVKYIYIYIYILCVYIHIYIYIYIYIYVYIVFYYTAMCITSFPGSEEFAAISAAAIRSGAAVVLSAYSPQAMIYYNIA